MLTRVSTIKGNVTGAGGEVFQGEVTLGPKKIYLRYYESDCHVISNPRPYGETDTLFGEMAAILGLCRKGRILQVNLEKRKVNVLHHLF